jgi:hypothetical protein
MLKCTHTHNTIKKKKKRKKEACALIPGNVLGVGGPSKPWAEQSRVDQALPFWKWKVRILSAHSIDKYVKHKTNKISWYLAYPILILKIVQSTSRKIIFQ